MNFTAAVKQELSALPPGKDCCMASELGALTLCCGVLSLLGGGRLQLKYISRSPSVLKRIFLLLKRRYQVVAFPRLVKLKRFGGQKQYELHLSPEDSRRLMEELKPPGSPTHNRLRVLPGRMLRRICCRRAWIRGAFLGCGSLAHPEKGYRAEFALEHEASAQYLLKLLALNDVTARLSIRHGISLVYLRQGDSLVTLLSLMGAGRAMMQTENIRAAADLKRDLNRAGNCDHANMMKQLAAAQHQLTMITRLSRRLGLSSLPKGLEQLARLRLQNPAAGLQELAQLMEPPLSKSGAQYRMKRLMDMAEALGEQDREGGSR